MMRRYSRSRWPYRSWRRYGSVTRSQQSGRRYFKISFPIENIVSLTVGANQSFSNVLRTCPWLSPTGTGDTDANRALNCCGLPGSVAYRRYCQLYDQVKVNSVYFSVCIADTIGQGGTFPGVRVYTSWDRDFQNGEPLVNANQLINGPESQVVTFINNSRAKFSRYNAASDLQERTTFIDASNQYNENVSWYNYQWGVAGSKPCGYSPSMSMVVQTSNTLTTARTVTVQIQARYNVTFRNPKFGLSVEGGNSKGGDDDFEKVVEEVKAESEDKKFDEIVERVIKKMKEGDGDVVVVKRESEVLPDDEDLMESQPAG